MGEPERRPTIQDMPYNEDKENSQATRSQNSKQSSVYIQQAKESEKIAREKVFRGNFFFLGVDYF